MGDVDVLVITALKLEHDAARAVAQRAGGRDHGVEVWKECGTKTAPYLEGTYVTPEGAKMVVALARPTRMGATSTLPIATALATSLQPRCLAMCGVCAGNPGDVALGDVIIAEMAYTYDEGKVKDSGFEGDHRQTRMVESWLRAAQNLTPEGLPCHGPASEEEARLWLLERLLTPEDPRKHPALGRYFPDDTWGERVQGYMDEGLVQRAGTTFKLKAKGRKLIERHVALGTTASPHQIPFEIKVGPIASGNVVVKDGVTWKKLAQWGVRSVLGLEMEAAAIASLAHSLELGAWVVTKGVMDYADPRKDDRYKEFAARASAEVLFRFLSYQVAGASVRPTASARMRTAFVIGGVTGETEFRDFEATEFQGQCNRLGRLLAAAGVDIVVCSPFHDSADVDVVKGYVDAGVGGRVHFHSPRHPKVAAMRAELERWLGSTKTDFVTWDYPRPENEDSWGQAWLLCQLQALARADVVIAIGGNVAKTANTLLHLAEAQGIPIVPFAFLGGAAQAAYKRRNWARTHPGFDHELLNHRRGVDHAIEIANRLVADAISARGRALGLPRTVFISRSRADSRIGDQLAKALTARRLQPVLGDDVINSARTTEASIDDAIRSADVVAVLWSGNYARSPWCYDELVLAVERETSGAARVWLFNLDGSQIVPRAARRLPQIVTRTAAEIVAALDDFLASSGG